MSPFCNRQHKKLKDEMIRMTLVLFKLLNTQFFICMKTKMFFVAVLALSAILFTGKGKQQWVGVDDVKKNFTVSSNSQIPPIQFPLPMPKLIDMGNLSA